MDDPRIYRVDSQLFRVDVKQASTPVQVLRDGEWHALVLSTHDLLSLMNAHELTSEELQSLDLPR
jgi:hypothetical protein